MHNAVVVVESVQLMGPGERSLNKPVWWMSWANGSPYRYDGTLESLDAEWCLCLWMCPNENCIDRKSVSYYAMQIENDLYVVAAITGLFQAENNIHRYVFVV